jgi:hypothetical protein
MSDYRRDLVIGFIEHLQIVTTSKDYAIALITASQIAIRHTKPSQPDVSSQVVVC